MVMPQKPLHPTYYALLITNPLSINKGDSYDRDPNLQVAEECFFHHGSTLPYTLLESSEFSLSGRISSSGMGCDEASESYLEW